MTVYDARRPGRMRPTLRLRLTLLNGILLIGTGAVLITLAWTVIADVLHPAQQLRPGTRVLLANGTSEDARTWQSEVQANAERELLLKGVSALLVVGAAGVVGAYWVAGRALRPLHRVTATARRIAESDADDRGLHERIALSGPRDEIRELADTFDTMLQRLDQSFAGHRRFIANAAHELRTSLVVNRSLLETAMSRPGAPVARRSGR